MNVVAILLAAGSATRFGSDKLLHPLPHEVPIAIQAARHLGAVFEGNVLVVMRPGARELSKLFNKEGCKVLECENAAEGMERALLARCGLRGMQRAL